MASPLPSALVEVFAKRNRSCSLQICQFHFLQKPVSNHFYKERGSNTLHEVRWLLRLPRASSGQAENQSIVQQLMREGNCLILFLKASPMGEKARIRCKFFLHRLTK